MTTARQTAEWKRQLGAIAAKVEAGEISPIVAAGAVRSAYETFLRETYRAPYRWEDREANRVWQARPNLNSPAGELAWWARSMEARGGRRKAFFTAPELWATIDAIMTANVARLRRMYGPPAWRWEP